MTSAKTNKMIRELIFDAIRRSYNNISTANVMYPRGGLFSNRVELERAFGTATSIIKKLSLRVANGETFIPAYLNYSIEYEIVFFSFIHAISDLWVGDKRLNEIQEAKEALKLLKELIKQEISPKEQLKKEQMLSIYEPQLKKAIGEE